MDAYYIDDYVPRVHNISYILSKVADSLNIDVDEEVYTLLDKLSAYYLQGRYPSYKDKISQLVDKVEANEVLKSSKEVFAWIRTLKELKK